MQVSNKGRSQHALKNMLKNKKIVKMNQNNSITLDTFLLQLKKKKKGISIPPQNKKINYL